MPKENNFHAGNGATRNFLPRSSSIGSRHIGPRLRRRCLDRPRRRCRLFGPRRFAQFRENIDGGFGGRDGLAEIEALHLIGVGVVKKFDLFGVSTPSTVTRMCISRPSAMIDFTTVSTWCSDFSKLFMKLRSILILSNGNFHR